MKSMLLTLLISLMSLVPLVSKADTPLKEGDYSWMTSLRTGHPRLFLTKDDIPQIRKTAFSFEKTTYDAMKKRADALLGKKIEFADPLMKTGEGHPNRLYGFYAADAAMMWLISMNRQYLDLTKYILKELSAYYKLRTDNNLNIEWAAYTQISALCAYDWIYNDLTPYERKSIGEVLFSSLCDAAWHGPGIREPRYRENTGNYQSGLYGVPVLPWYIGLTFYKEGFDDAFCEDMIRNGYDLHQDMTEFRAEMLGTNGGGASGVAVYSLGGYPFAEYDFLYTFLSATGIDISERLDYMIGYLNYMDWIRLPGNKEYGFGDTNHYKCALPYPYMNLHVRQIADFFGQNHPEIIPVAARLATMYDGRRPIDEIPFIRLLHKSDPVAKVEEQPSSVQNGPKSMYFDTMGQLYMRSGTGDDDTYVLFTAGGSASNHKHYDNNNFVIYKHGYRALDSGTRPEPGWHLPYYYARTVAHNCVTVYMPGETFPKHWGGPAACEEKVVKMPNDGGQLSQLGSKVLVHEETDDYVYVVSDATACYNPDKVDLVVREFIWCVPDLFVVFDKIVSDKKEYKKTWLYHTAEEPSMKGKCEFSEKSQGGKSVCRTLYPENAVVTKIGGPGKQFWSDGTNWEIPVLTPEDYGYPQRANIPSNEWPLVGQWRVEVSPAVEAESDIFVHMIQVGKESMGGLPKAKTVEDEKSLTVEFKYEDKKFRLTFDKTSDYGCKIEVNN